MEIGRVRRGTVTSERKIVSEKKIFPKVLVRKDIKNQKNNSKK
ncbi:hypothetical protein DFM98_002822 [Clostridium beijerinckii]|nr:hypothetical protein [Clostridium beijerinckii]